MTDKSYPTTEQLFPRLVETIELRGGRQAHIPVVGIIEAIGGVAHLLLVFSIPRLLHTIGVHTVVEVKFGIQGNGIEQSEIGLNRNAMVEAVPPVFYQIRMQQLIFLGYDAVGYFTCITHGDLLIPALITHCLLPLKRIELRNRDAQ